TLRACSLHATDERIDDDPHQLRDGQLRGRSDEQRAVRQHGQAAVATDIAHRAQEGAEIWAWRTRAALWSSARSRLAILSVWSLAVGHDLQRSSDELCRYIGSSVGGGP